MHDHRFDRIDAKLQILEDKMTSHLIAHTNNTKDIQWLKGHLNTMTALFLGVVTAMISYFWKHFTRS